MSEKFYTILTNIGKAKIANSNALGTKLNLTKFQVGDSKGAYYNPTEDQTELKNKVWEGSISNITIDKENLTWIVIEVVIPSSAGGFMIREAGILDDEGNLIAIGKYPETYKPVVAEGGAKDLVIRMILEISNTSSVALKLNPTVILATQKDIQVLDNNIKKELKILDTKIDNIKISVLSVNNKTGNIDNLKTIDKSNLVNAINENVLRLNELDATVENKLLHGTTKLTEFLGDGSIRETSKDSKGNVVFISTTFFNKDGSISERKEKFENGELVEKYTIKTAFNIDGSIEMGVEK